MKWLRGSGRSVIAGMATAALLLGFYWHFIGSVFYANLDRTYYAVHVMLIPEFLAAAFAAGMAVGMIKSSGRLAEPSVRACATVVIFAILASPFFLTGGFVAVKPLTLHAVLMDVAATICMIPFSLIASTIYFCPAAVGGYIGKYFLEKQIRAGISVFLILIIALSGIIVYRGAQLSSIMVDLDRIPALIKPDIQAVPDNDDWKRQADINQSFEVESLRYTVPNGFLIVELSKNRKPESVFLHLIAPKGMKLESKGVALDFLRKHNIKESRFKNLHIEGQGQWTAEQGNFSLFLDEYYIIEED